MDWRGQDWGVTMASVQGRKISRVKQVVWGTESFQCPEERKYTPVCVRIGRKTAQLYAFNHFNWQQSEFQ